MPAVRDIDTAADIDDTIKITQTSDPIGILRSTFVSEPTPVAGMPELYQFINKQITPKIPFFYLSASPYNLYSFLRDFRDKYYPPGTIILRDANWMNLSGLLSNLTLGTQEYKVDRIVKINNWFPLRHMICIGDSTQTDPETYGEMYTPTSRQLMYFATNFSFRYRRYPAWVKLILIRKVTDIAAVGIEEKNEPARFEKAFHDVPKHVWHVFTDALECYPHIKKVLATWRLP